VDDQLHVQSEKYKENWKYVFLMIFHECTTCGNWDITSKLNIFSIVNCAVPYLKPSNIT